jgi:hypothetical protein
MSLYKLLTNCFELSSPLFLYARKALGPQFWGTLMSGIPPKLIPMAKYTFGNTCDDTNAFEAPQPPILGEPEAGSPPELGDLGGLQPGCNLAKCFASSIKIGGTKGGK